MLQRKAQAQLSESLHKPEKPKPAIAQPDIAKPEVAKPEKPKPEVAKPEKPKPEVAKPEIVKPAPTPIASPSLPTPKAVPGKCILSPCGLLHFNSLRQTSAAPLGARPCCWICRRSNQRLYQRMERRSWFVHFRDSLTLQALCALLHSYYPEKIDFQSLKKENALANLQLAFSTAGALGINLFMGPEDILGQGSRIDPLSFMAFFAEFFYRFVGGDRRRGIGSLEYIVQ